jgi:hypothetical protein
VAAPGRVQPLLFHSAIMLEVDVRDVVCGGCQSTVKYDGLEDAILNQDATALFTHEFLQGYEMLPTTWIVSISMCARGDAVAFDSFESV